MVQAKRSDRQHRDARLADQERIFVGAMHGAAIFYNPQPPSGNLVHTPVIEHDDVWLGLAPPVETSEIFRGHPLAVPPTRAGAVFYGIWPAMVIAAGVFVRRRQA